MAIERNIDSVSYRPECVPVATMRRTSNTDTMQHNNTDTIVFSPDYTPADVTAIDDTKYIKSGRPDDTIVSAADVISVNSDLSTSSSLKERLRTRAKKVSRRIRRKIRKGLDLDYRKVVLGTISIILFGLAAMYIRENDVVGKFLVWVETAPVWTATLAFSALYFFVALPIGFGYLILNLGAGYLYGLWVGMIVTVISSSIGTLLAVATCRFFLHDWVHSKVEGYPTMGALLRVVNGPSKLRVIVLSRLSPFPYGLQNAVFALCNVGLLKFSLISCLACLPMQLLNTWMGSNLKSVQDVLNGGGSMDVTTYAAFAIQLVVGILLLAGILYATKIEFHKMVGQESGGNDIESGIVEFSDEDLDYQLVPSDSDDEANDITSLISTGDL